MRTGIKSSIPRGTKVSRFIFHDNRLFSMLILRGHALFP